MQSRPGVYPLGVINSWLLVVLSFSFMFSVAFGNILLFLILFLWLWEGEFATRFAAVKSNPFAQAAVLFVALHFVGLLWTSDWEFAGFVMGKELKYLMIPVLMTVVRKEHVVYYLAAFLCSMTIIVLLSYGLHWDIIPSYDFLKMRDPIDKIPFVHHIVYSPMLAFTLYLLLYTIFLLDNVPQKIKMLGLALFIFMVINLFITPGRMGQVVFLVLLVLFVFQVQRGKVLKPALMALLLLATIVPAAYLLSPVVKERVDLAVHEVQDYKAEPNSSMGLRVIMLLNSVELIEENPLIGVGTGDYQQEYNKVNRLSFPQAVRGESLAHPHNVYVQEMVQFGIAGLLVVLYWFYVMLKMYKQSSSPLKPVMLAFPVFYFVIFFSDGYIMNHYLTIFFLLLGSVLYTSDGQWPSRSVAGLPLP
jgi:O-antigen ligase